MHLYPTCSLVSSLFYLKHFFLRFSLVIVYVYSSELQGHLVAASSKEPLPALSFLSHH